METLLKNVYTRLDQQSKLFKTNSIATGTKELLQRKIYVQKCLFLIKWHFENFINLLNGGDEMIWELRMEFSNTHREKLCFIQFSKTNG